MATASGTLTPPVESGHAGAWRPSAAGWAARLGILAALFLGLIWGVSIVSDVWADRVAHASIYAIIGLSLNIIMGYVGQVSLGHHAFVGLAAFGSAFMVTTKGQPFPVGVLVACAFGGLTAGLLGLVALRIKGLYLALITLTFGFVAVNSFFEIPALTGGGQGLAAPKPSLFSSDAAYAYLCLGLLGLVLFVDWRLLSSKVGRGILAVKESEAVAASYAVNVTSYKVMAFVLSGVFAGLAGALFAHRNTQVVAADFNFSTSLLWVLMVVVGGLGNRVGVVIASAFFALFTDLVGLFGPLEHFLTNTFKRSPAEFEGLIGALLALLTIILHPGGISDQVAPLVRWFGGHKFSLHGDDHGPAEKKPNPIAKVLGRSKSAHEPVEGEQDAPQDAADAAAAAGTKGSPSAPGTGSLTAALGQATGAAGLDAESDDDASSHPATDDGAGADETAPIAVTGSETAETPVVEPEKKKRRRSKKSASSSEGDN